MGIRCTSTSSELKLGLVRQHPVDHPGHTPRACSTCSSRPARRSPSGPWSSWSRWPTRRRSPCDYAKCCGTNVTSPAARSASGSPATCTTPSSSRCSPSACRPSRWRCWADAANAVSARAVRRIADEVGTLSRTVLADLRAMVHELRPAPSAELGGLEEAIRALVDSTANRTGLRFSLEIGRGLERIKGKQAEDVYRIVAEAIHNVVKHADGGQGGDPGRPPRGPAHGERRRRRPLDRRRRRARRHLRPRGRVRPALDAGKGGAMGWKCDRSATGGPRHRRPAHGAAGGPPPAGRRGVGITDRPDPQERAS